VTELENGRPQNCGAIPNRRNRLSLLQSTRFVRKLSSHFEYLEKRSRGLHVTWQPVKGDLSAHSPVGLVSRQWDAVYWAGVLCDCRIHNDRVSRSAHHDNAPAHYTALVQAFLAKHHITQVCQPPYNSGLAPCDFWLFPNLKSPLKDRRFVNAMVTQYTTSDNSISLLND